MGSFQPQIDGVKGLLKDHAAEWTDRKNALDTIRSVIAAATDKNLLLDCIKQLQPLLAIQLEDRRSSYCQEVCDTITKAAQALGDLFEQLAQGFLSALFPLLMVTISAIAVPAHNCINSILPYSVSCIPSIVQGIKDKHPAVRAKCTEYLCALLENTPLLEKMNTESYLASIDEGIRCAINDLKPEARTLAKRSYQAVGKRWPEVAQKLLASLDPSIQKRLQAQDAVKAPVKKPTSAFAEFRAKKQATTKPATFTVTDAQTDVISSKDNTDDNDDNTPPPNGSPSASNNSTSSTSTTSITSSSTSNDKAKSTNSSDKTTSSDSVTPAAATTAQGVICETPTVALTTPLPPSPHPESILQESIETEIKFRPQSTLPVLQDSTNTSTPEKPALGSSSESPAESESTASPLPVHRAQKRTLSALKSKPTKTITRPAKSRLVVVSSPSDDKENIENINTPEKPVSKKLRVARGALEYSPGSTPIAARVKTHRRTASGNAAASTSSSAKRALKL